MNTPSGQRLRYPGLLPRAVSLLAALCLAAPPSRPEVVVVVAHNSPIRDLSDREIADVFLGKLSRLPGVGAVVPLDQMEGGAARNEFYMKLTGKSPAQVRSFWSKVIFTGRGRPPRILANDAAVIRALRVNPGAIGYVSRASTDAGVRILR
ncbi:MAG: phosphate ABC transporter substrate-binding protein [Steroidobacteraceae bacterium]